MINVINPATEEIIESYELSDVVEIKNSIDALQQGFTDWSQIDVKKRSSYIHYLSKLIFQSVDKYARLITIEMGKPLKESKSEIEKCALLCNYYADHAEAFLADKEIDENFIISYEPLGVILGVMPWNFPFWQAFRFIIPTLLAGNTILLKHALNVPGSALAIAHLIEEAKFPCTVFKNIFSKHENIAEIIENPFIKAISLTGSETAGRSIAEQAGKSLKKCVLELGGSDPFIVLEDADLSTCIPKAISGRLINTGQSCIAAKRFIVVQSRINEFVDNLLKELSSINLGNPLDEESMIGPLARRDLLDSLELQVKKSISLGAELLTGGERLERVGFYYPPTVLKNVFKGMPAFDEELFGPVFAIIEAKDDEDAIRLANDSNYGLGASIWTQNKEKGLQLARKVQSGMVFINGITVSNPKVPFGGIKNSGYGRELSEEGIKEFVNIKSIVMN